MREHSPVAERATPERDHRVKLVRLTGTDAETKRALLGEYYRPPMKAADLLAFPSRRLPPGGCNVFAAFLRVHQMERGSGMDDQGPKAGNQRGADGFGSLLEAVFEGVFEVDGEFAFLVVGVCLLILAIIFIPRTLYRLAGWGWRFFRSRAGDKVNAGSAKGRLRITP